VFGGLFHDLAESLTRDIISPVKRSIKGLDTLIAGFETEEMAKRLNPLLPDAMRKHIAFWTHDEFRNRFLDGRPHGQDEELPNREIDRLYGHEDVLDGRVLKACDDLAALMEADCSMRHGITSEDIEEGKRTLLARYKCVPSPAAEELSDDEKKERSMQADLRAYLSEPKHNLMTMFDYFA
jgi:putative hydrolase of HD superfamily